MPRGRPKTIDEEELLGAVMRELWQDGVRGVSLNALAVRLGVSKPALVSAFGNKEALIVKALEHYASIEQPRAAAALVAGAPLRDVMRRYLQVFIDGFTVPGMPRGCLLATASGECAVGEMDQVRRALNMLLTGTRTTLLDFLRSERHEDAEGLADFVLGQTTAMSTMARGGATKADLERFADFAVAGL